MRFLLVQSCFTVKDGVCRHPFAELSSVCLRFFFHFAHFLFKLYLVFLELVTCPILFGPVQNTIPTKSAAAVSKE